MIQSLEELIVPGRVLRLFCSFTSPPKEKYVIVVAIKPFCLGFLINSTPTDLQKSKPHLMDEMIPVAKADGYNFLSNTDPSVIDCTYPADLDVDEVVVQLGQDPGRCLCMITTATRERILKIVGRSLMIEGGIAKIIGKNLIA